jgi:AbrB family looped-hinge helix DNA binding protein
MGVEMSATIDRLMSVEFLSTAYIGEKGQVTIPKTFRDSLTLESGAPIAIVQVGAGLLLIPEQVRFRELCARIAGTFARHGVTADDLLSSLGKTRERVFSDLYPDIAGGGRTRKVVSKKRR